MIAGLQKMTLLDFPGRVACTVFTQGCNYRCPFCHNSDLLPHQGQGLMEDGELLAFLKKRQGLLDGVCITGGEPTLYPCLETLLTEIKALGFAVKLDTNGSNPAILKKLVTKGLVDYVAMDVKNSPSRYAETVGLPRVNLAPIEESLRYLIDGNVAYELRTTVTDQLHDEASILEMGQWLSSLVPGKRPAALWLQKFVDRESVIFAGFTPPAPEKLTRFVEILTLHTHFVKIRSE